MLLLNLGSLTRCTLFTRPLPTSPTFFRASVSSMLLSSAPSRPRFYTENIYKNSLYALNEKCINKWCLPLNPFYHRSSQVRHPRENHTISWKWLGILSEANKQQMENKEHSKYKLVFSLWHHRFKNLPSDPPENIWLGQNQPSVYFLLLPSFVLHWESCKDGKDCLLSHKWQASLKVHHKHNQRYASEMYTSLICKTLTEVNHSWEEKVMGSRKLIMMENNNSIIVVQRSSKETLKARCKGEKKSRLEFRENIAKEHKGNQIFYLPCVRTISTTENEIS